MVRLTAEGGAYYQTEDKTPDLRFLPDGRGLLRFSLRFWQGKEKDDGWLRVTVFGDLAERAAESIRHGDRVTVSGRFEHRRGDDGREWVGVVADDVGVSLRYDAATSKRVQRAAPQVQPQSPDEAPF